MQITGSGSAATVSGATHAITNLYVPVGARSFGVDSTSGLALGDHDFVRRVATSNWIHDIGMDLLTNPWTSDGYNIDMDRVITRIEGSRIFVDAPVTCAIDAHHTNGTIRKFIWSGRIANSGIEHIYARSDYFGNTTNENHAWIFVQFNSTEDGWARDLVSQYFGYACVALYSGAKHITISDCQCLDPISIITGGRRYAFVMDDDTLCLVRNCYTRQDRHQFVTQSLTTGPNVFVDGVSDNAHAEAGPHHRWATAAIWDNITVNGHNLDAQNTCESGTGHGWEGANCVIYNSVANNLVVSSPPGARNWLIGSVGVVSDGSSCHGIPPGPGTYDSSGPANAGGTNVFPDSLYFAQLQNRLAAPNLQTRDYWLGEIDGFTNATTRVLDLAGQLGLLTNGQLNVAIQGDIGVDWAMLELQVAPNINARTLLLAPAADATVREGTFAGNNFGTTNTLSVRNDSSANNTREAYLRWDLTGLTQAVYQARVSLTPVGVGTNDIEQGGGERFANWIPGTNAPVSFDVTPQVLDALANDKQLSLQVYSVRNVGTAGSVDYASREYSDPGSQPQLILALLGTPPVIPAITNRTVAVNGSTGPIPFTIGDPDSATSALILSGDSSNPGLVPDANIVFGGSNSNRSVTITPTASQSGLATITITVTDPSGLSASSQFTLTVGNHTPGVFVWNGPGAGANNWSAGGNWSPAGPPEAFDDAKFYNTGATGLAVSNINNLVDAGFGRTIASLQYGNNNGNHTIMITAGSTLTVAGANGLIVGTETDNGTAQTVFSTITGPGGTLVINNPSADLIVRQGTLNSGGSQRATLDMSGLGTFTAALNQVLVGFVGSVNRATGTLYLGKTNTIIVTGSPGIGAGDNNSNSGGQNLIYLGQTNAIFADSIMIAMRKATATLRFNPALANPSALFRASDGASRVSTWNIADNSGESNSSSSALGTNDFSGGTVDALVDTLAVGKSQTTTGANSTGVLTFTSGTFDVNTLQVGFQAASGATSAGIGRVNVSGTGAVLVVNSSLELGHTNGGAGTTNTFGTLYINGGTVVANTIIAGAGSVSNTLAMNGGTLNFATTAGTPAAPINNVALTNSTLLFAAATGTTNLVAIAFVTGGASNSISITLLPSLTIFPAQFPLIQHSGAITGTGYNFTLGALPAGAYCGGYLSNNAANSSIDLVTTNCLVPNPFLTWDGSFSGDWDSETGNWKNNLSAGLIYSDGNNVVFNDTVSGATNINLTDTFAPVSVTVSNNAKTYQFGDIGSLTGSTSLNKLGPGILIIANSGNNDFTGGITIAGGALQVGNGGNTGNLPTGNILDNAALMFSRSDNITVANTISGSGTLAQIGSGILTLSGANSFTGRVIVTNDTLQVGNTSALGAGTVISNSGTLDLNGFNLGSDPVTASGPGVGGNGAIINNGPAQTTALKTVVLAGNLALRIATGQGGHLAPVTAARFRMNDGFESHLFNLRPRPNAASRKLPQAPAGRIMFPRPGTPPTAGNKPAPPHGTLARPSFFRSPCIGGQNLSHEPVPPCLQWVMPILKGAGSTLLCSYFGYGKRISTRAKSVNSEHRHEPLALREQPGKDYGS